MSVIYGRYGHLNAACRSSHCERQPSPARGGPRPRGRPVGFWSPTTTASTPRPLLPLLASLGTLGPARALVPDRECSWSSKTLTRFGRLRLRRVSAGDRTLHTLDGSPADCANAGVHNLAASPPRLAVSGINIGANAGLAFLLSSGTVGAAVEAALSGVPAVAFSLQLRPDDYARWRSDRRDSLPPGAWEQAAAVAREITSEVLRGGLPEGARLLSVNLPPGAGPGTRRVLTRVTPSAYGRFFRHDGDGRLGARPPPACGVTASWRTGIWTSWRRDGSRSRP